MAIQQQELDKLLQLGKEIALAFMPVAAQPITITTASGVRRTNAWVFPSGNTGLAQYGNIVGRNGAIWQHMKTVDAWNIFSNPDDTFQSVHDVLSAMRDSV
jgi:hypothetical protein